jgi:hypothetical protein
MPSIKTLIAGTLIVLLPLSAAASVSYTYTGSLFTQKQGEIEYYWEGVTVVFTPALLDTIFNQPVHATLELPFYLPDGWTTFSNSGISNPSVVHSLQDLQAQGATDPGFRWDIGSSIYRESGFLSLTTGVNDPRMGTFSMSLHVSNTNQVDAWEFSTSACEYCIGVPAGPQGSVISSSLNGDSTFLQNGKYVTATMSASTPAVGSWQVAEIAAVPEPASYWMLLGGLAALAGVRSRRSRGKPVI